MWISDLRAQGAGRRAQEKSSAPAQTSVSSFPQFSIFNFQFSIRSHSPLPPAPSALRPNQEGFTLAGLIVILTIMSVIVAFTVPEQWSRVMGRERDRQTIFLMKQYARSILRWQQRHGALPTSLDQLEKARRPRFVRGGDRRPMPVSGNPEDWIMVPPGAVEQQQLNTGGGTVPTGGGMPGGSTDTSKNTPGNRITSPWTKQPGFQNAPPAAGGGSTTRLNPEASPADYVGPFVAVRPNAQGKSFIAFNGNEDYSQWVYTVQDLQNEIAMRQQALMTK